MGARETALPPAGKDPEEKKGNPLDNAQVQLKVYETTYCDPSAPGGCEPGYFASDTGIHAELDLVMTFTEDGHPYPDVIGPVEVPYNAVIWSAAMAYVPGFNFSPA